MRFRSYKLLIVLNDVVRCRGYAAVVIICDYTNGKSVMLRSIQSALDRMGPITPRDTLDTRLSMVLSIEWTLLALRYFVIFLVVGLYALDVEPKYSPDPRIVVIAAFIQNAFVHYVFYSERYLLFVSPLNFVIHLVNVCVAVGSTGGEQSPIVMVYILVIAAYCIYEPHFLNTISVTLICCSAYSLTVLARWFFAGINMDYPPIGLQLCFILLSGFLMRILGELVRRMRIEAQSQAQALASSRAAIRAILDSAAEPIVVYDDNEFITDVNERACEFLGLSRANLVGQRFRTFIFDDGSLSSRLANLRIQGEYRGEVLVITADADERTAAAMVRAFFRDNQRFFVAILHDITKQKALQEAARQANLHLEQINRELQQVNQLRSAFFKTVSQRVRSPLSAILGFHEMLLNEELGELTEDQRKALQSCRRSAQRIFSLVDEPFEQKALSAEEEGMAAGIQETGQKQP